MEIIDQLQPQSHRSDAPISVGQWVIIMLLMWIPILNFVMLFLWAFDGNTHPAKANWAKAVLIWIGIVMGLLIFVWTASIMLRLPTLSF
ncbi:MAG: hypothetical protein FWE30_03850 [Bacteroidales bacterium]|nr:hypothetical protein [Bacteroidales bacterium]